MPEFGKRGARPPAIKVNPPELKREDGVSKPISREARVLIAAFGIFIITIMTTGVVIWPVMFNKTSMSDSASTGNPPSSGGIFGRGFGRFFGKVFGGFGQSGAEHIGQAGS